ncbi:hypothetical protein V1281_005473 [Nitrobacteraceae bacterium AZCC 2161]
MARGYGKLKAKQIEQLSERGLYGDGGGLYLQVAKGGSRSWLFRFKTDGRSRWHGLGSARDVSLADARIKAGDARRVRLNGGDPIEAKREVKAAARVEAAKSITFGAAAKRFIKANAPGWKNAKHSAQWQMTLLGIDPNGKPAKNDYCKSIRDLPITAKAFAIFQSVPSTRRWYCALSNRSGQTRPRRPAAFVVASRR